MTKASPSIEDITDRFADLNAHDRVYRSASGYTVKVKAVRRETGSPDRICIVVSGALCDDATAKARRHDGGHFVCPGHEVSVQSDSPADLAALVEAARLQAVARVELAAIHQAQAEAIKGVL